VLDSQVWLEEIFSSFFSELDVSDPVGLASHGFRKSSSSWRELTYHVRMVSARGAAAAAAR